jgi:hypothetical protein
MAQNLAGNKNSQNLSLISFLKRATVNTTHLVDELNFQYKKISCSSFFPNLNIKE